MFYINIYWDNSGNDLNQHGLIGFSKCSSMSHSSKNQWLNHLWYFLNCSFWILRKRKYYSISLYLKLWLWFFSNYVFFIISKSCKVWESLLRKKHQQSFLFVKILSFNEHLLSDVYMLRTRIVLSEMRGSPAYGPNSRRLKFIWEYKPTYMKIICGEK